MWWRPLVDNFPASRCTFSLETAFPRSENPSEDDCSVQYFIKIEVFFMTSADAKDLSRSWTVRKTYLVRCCKLYHSILLL
jgi:hypothetical protein